MTRYGRRSPPGSPRRAFEAPRSSTRGGDLAAHWRRPGLVFGQTCGYPYVTGLKDAVDADRDARIRISRLRRRFASKLHRSAAPATRAARLSEFRGATAALNAWDSNTGMNLFRAAIAPVAGGAPFFRAIVVTGSHEASMAAVAEGRADLASIDCVSFALLERGRPDLIERVAVVAESRALAEPAVHRERASLGRSTIAAVREALFAALADPDLAESARTLGLKGARLRARRTTIG